MAPRLIHWHRVMWGSGSGTPFAQREVSGELLAVDLLAAGWSLRYLPELTVHHAASSARGLPWAVREPHRLPPAVEGQLNLMDTQRLNSTARRYVS